MNSRVMKQVAPLILAGVVGAEGAYCQELKVVVSSKAKAYIEGNPFGDVEGEGDGGTRGRPSWKYPDGAWIGGVSGVSPRHGSVAYAFEFKAPTEQFSLVTEIRGMVSLCIAERCRVTPEPGAIYGAQVSAWNFSKRRWEYLDILPSWETMSRIKITSNFSDSRAGSPARSLGNGRYRVMIRLGYEPGDPTLGTRYEIESVTLHVRVMASSSSYERNSSTF